MKDLILKEVEDAVLAVNTLKKADALSFIEKVSYTIANAYKNNKKIIIAGNGGSLCDGMHFAEELTGQFRKKRKALNAISLSDPGFLSCCANDFGYESVFSRGVEAYGSKDDIFIALSTSGNSENLVNAVKMASDMGLITIAFLGKDGGNMKNSCDIEWVVKGFLTSDRIQEAHMSAIHIIIRIIEEQLFYNSALKNVQKVHETISKSKV
jgi:D-sedoheptulose 7-phosphate isomerase